MHVLITGGAGFIGSNAAKSFAQDGWRVSILDNLSRVGSNRNLEWLRHQVTIDFFEADVRNTSEIDRIVSQGDFDTVIHLAGQVAVTTSVISPRLDFETNVLGTFNLLEAIRNYSPNTILLNASTNKVYGGLSGVQIRERDQRYEFADNPCGIAETHALDFHSPYGCSKGAADQYVIDYARIYGLRTVSFRQSCIYGTRQLGVEDQGWVAWFIIAHLLGKPIKIYGNGKQVRDVLFVDDLVAAYKAAIQKIDAVSGQVFNIGGGVQNTLSLLELIDYLGDISGKKVDHSFSDWRPGDQPVYMSDIQKASQSLNWEPGTSVKDGVAKLYDWVSHNKPLFSQMDGE